MNLFFHHPKWPLPNHLSQLFLGGLDLGYAACGEKIFVQDLVSSTSGYSWDKAAALIQSFGVHDVDNDLLDLSIIDQTKLDLKNESYSSLDVDALHSAADSAGAFNGLSQKPVVKTVAQARSAANLSLGANISLPSQLELVLDQLKETGEVVLQAELISETLIPGVDDSCWKNMRAVASVSVNDQGVYSFNVDRAVSYDDAEVVSPTHTCLIEDADECEEIESNLLPQPKIITGKKVDMIFSSTFAHPNYTEVNVRSTNALSLDTTIGKGKVSFSGVFDNKVTALNGELAGKSMSCKYRVTASKAVQTEILPSYFPKAGIYSGIAQCTDDTELNVSVDVKETAANARAEVNIVEMAFNETLRFAFEQDPEDDTKGSYGILYEFPGDYEDPAQPIDFTVHSYDGYMDFSMIRATSTCYAELEKE